MTGNPNFECIIPDAEIKQRLIDLGYPKASDYRLKEEAENELGAFFHKHASEWHPAKDSAGNNLYNFEAEFLFDKKFPKPQCVDLLEPLEQHTEKREADLDPLRKILLALIEDGQRHEMHGHDPPTWGCHACARKGSKSEGTEYVYCRYLFPKPLLRLDWNKLATVVDDKHRPGLRNLCLARNDSLINSFEEHLLLANLGNIDWRPLLNLWAVLDYLTKYNAKAGKGSKKFAHVFTEVLDQICTWDTDNGLHDLWRRMIFKCYSRVLGGRDYSLLETMHYGLRLPPAVSNVGHVKSVSVSSWSSLKHKMQIKHAEGHDRVTNYTKLESFDRRLALARPASIEEHELEDFSMYAFWRLFDVEKNRLKKHRKEPMAALSGLGWPAQARVTHPRHAEYAKRALLAYMPCPGSSGTEYIESVVKRDYDSSWPAFFREFVLDTRNFWCPTWLARNYEKENDVVQGLPVDQLVLPPLPSEFSPEEQEAQKNKQKWPHHDKFLPVRLRFDKSGEPEKREDDDKDENDVEHPNTQAPQDCWDKENRPSWMLHSELGPNLKPEGYTIKQAPLQEVVNPVDVDYSVRAVTVDHDAWQRTWEAAATSSSRYEDHSLRKELLKDDHQLLFVNIILDYVEKVIPKVKNKQPLDVKPLRLFLLGTAGTCKTRAVRTALQEIYRLLDSYGLSVDFVRCAAPTGTAAFNMRFNATTVHRLIRWTNLRRFDEIGNPDLLAALQAHLGQTCLVFLDEVSMIGRTMMGRIDSRFRQGKATDETLGGVGCVGVGGPAQCEAMFQKQIYDETPARDDVDGGEKKKHATVQQGAGRFRRVSRGHRPYHSPQNGPDREAENARGSRVQRSRTNLLGHHAPLARLQDNPGGLLLALPQKGEQVDAVRAEVLR